MVTIFRADDAACTKLPLSLIAFHFGKFMNKRTYEKLLNQLSDKLHDYQHGLIKGRSTCSQLLKFVGDLGKPLD